MRLTAKERILLHLLESAQPADDVEVSPRAAQEGVARGAGIELRHLAQFVRPLIQEGLVRERRAHVAGIRQRRKVYELTLSGRTSAICLRGKVGAQVVRFRDGDLVRQGSLHEALRGMGSRTSLLEAVRQVQEVGILDLEITRHPPESGLVEHTWDAPRIGTFVGRREELAQVLREDGVSRIFVVRGIAGIGKSAFGAKTCELLRGRRNLFWHRVRSWESGQTILASLGRFLEALDRPGLATALTRGEAALAAEALRQDLPDTHALLVFDDAHEATREVLPVFQMLAEAAASAPDVRTLILTRKALPFYDVRDVALRGLVGEIELGGLAPEDAAAFLAEGGDTAELADLGHRLAGHPLFLELIRKHRPNLPEAIRDMHRFVEEAMYRDLADSERDTMKAASLYEVPVPRSTLLLIPGFSYEALLALQDRGLIRPVRSERYEIHDTIRDFFGDILTPQERERYGMLAATQLHELAGQASASGDLVAAIACLSNALHVTPSPGERADLYESLGDANHRIGDVSSMSTAYREGLRIVTNPEIVARLHRKLASALEDRGYMAAARKEVEAGLAAIAKQESLEHGWLNLARARIAKEDFDWGATEGYAERARETFERFGNLTGQAHALLEAGLAASWTGSVSEDGAPRAQVRFPAALALAKAEGDPVLEARIHIAMATAIGYGSGDYEEGMRHYRAVEFSPTAMADPNVAPSLYFWRAWFVLRTRRDLSAAERDLSLSRQLAQKVHSAGALGTVQHLYALIAGDRGQYGDAARFDEDAGAALVRAGLVAFAADAYFGAAGFHLAAGDSAGYRRLSSALQNPPLCRYVENPIERPAIHRALEALLGRDVEGFERTFARIFHAADALPTHSLHRTAHLWWDYFYCSLGLRALGREQEAEDHLRRAVELVRSVQYPLGVHYLESDYGERVVQTLRDGMKFA